jgi:hypothetical protein
VQDIANEQRKQDGERGHTDEVGQSRAEQRGHEPLLTSHVRNPLHGLGEGRAVMRRARSAELHREEAGSRNGETERVNAKGPRVANGRHDDSPYGGTDESLGELTAHLSKGISLDQKMVVEQFGDDRH